MSSNRQQATNQRGNVHGEATDKHISAQDQPDIEITEPNDDSDDLVILDGPPADVFTTFRSNAEVSWHSSSSGSSKNTKDIDTRTPVESTTSVRNGSSDDHGKHVNGDTEGNSQVMYSLARIPTKEQQALFARASSRLSIHDHGSTTSKVTAPVYMATENSVDSVSSPVDLIHNTGHIIDLTQRDSRNINSSEGSRQPATPSPLKRNVNDAISDVSNDEHVTPKRSAQTIRHQTGADRSRPSKPHQAQSGRVSGPSGNTTTPTKSSKHMQDKTEDTPLVPTCGQVSTIRADSPAIRPNVTLDLSTNESLAPNTVQRHGNDEDASSDGTAAVLVTPVKATAAQIEQADPLGTFIIYHHHSGVTRLSHSTALAVEDVNSNLIQYSQPVLLKMPAMDNRHVVIVERQLHNVPTDARLEMKGEKPVRFVCLSRELRDSKSNRYREALRLNLVASLSEACRVRMSQGKSYLEHSSSQSGSGSATATKDERSQTESRQ